MGAPTIPQPSKDDFKVARTALENSAQANGLDIEDPNVQAFIRQQVSVKAWKASECRWLSNIVHRCAGDIQQE